MGSTSSDDSESGRAFIPEPTDETVRALLAKHGLSHDGEVEPAAFPGSINHTRLVGDLVVKFGKLPADFGDVYTEVVAAPAAVTAGARTPALRHFDDSRDLYPGPVTVWDRVEGVALGDLFEVPDLRKIYMACAEQARIWTEAVVTVDDPNGWLDKPEPIDPWASLARCSGRMDDGTREWAESTLYRLDMAPPGRATFGHWDLHAHNLLVHEGALAAVIDWGDAGFGDPILNFTCFPAEYLPAVVEIFGRPDDGFIGRLLRETLGYALNAYGIEDWPTLRNTGMKRWRSFVRLYDQTLDEEWRQWLGDPPLIAR